MFKTASIRFYISDRVEEFRKIGAEGIGASVDSHFTHLAWIKTPRKEGGLGKMNIPLVSDLTKGKVDFSFQTFKTYISKTLIYSIIFFRNFTIIWSSFRRPGNHSQRSFHH